MCACSRHTVTFCVLDEKTHFNFSYLKKRPHFRLANLGLHPSKSEYGELAGAFKRDSILIKFWTAAQIRPVLGEKK
jgi:hypothetical protein